MKMTLNLKFIRHFLEYCDPIKEFFRKKPTFFKAQIVLTECSFSRLNEIMLHILNETLYKVLSTVA